MKTTSFSLLLALLPLALGACANGPALPGDDREDDPSAAPSAEETVRVTIIDHDDNGGRRQQIVELSRAEAEQLEATRPGAPKRTPAAAPSDGEHVATAEQALSVGANVAGCYARGLLIYSNTNLGGDVLCMMSLGHEGGGTAGVYLPADWLMQNGGKFPLSYWSGEDGGRFSGSSQSVDFNPWTVVNNAPWWVSIASYVQLHRKLGVPGTDPSIAVPANYPLVHKMAARGHQIYVCKDQGGGSFAWTLSAPSALLTDTHPPYDVIGWHYAGPQWRAADDNSSITAAKVAQVASPDPGAIPWLKLQVTSHQGAGLFAPVAFVQRINTTGGLAPTTACDQYSRNQTVWVDYTADYYFYAEPTAPAGWTCASWYYNGSDGCDCACGMPDPDCAKLDQYLYGCASGQVCNQSGQCVAP